MKIDQKKVGKVFVLKLDGPLRFPEGTAKLREQSRELAEAGENDVVIDMLDVPWLDSSGIGEVVASFKRAREKNGVVKLVMRDRTQRQFTYCYLEKMFEIFEEEESAVASFDH